MERLPLHIGLFFLYILVQLVTTSFSSSSTGPPGATKLPVEPTASGVAKEGQKEQVPGEQTTEVDKKDNTTGTTTVGSAFLLIGQHRKEFTT